MRRIGPFVVVFLLAACSQEPDFDARYEKANADIAARVKALDEAVTEMEESDNSVAGASTVKFSLPVGEAAARDGASSGE